MESRRSLCLLWVVCACSFYSSSAAYTFYAGGKDGWVLNPRESYNHWAGRNRFQVNDTIVFEYKKGSDSVLLVDKEDYSNCNTKKPLEMIMETGSTVFKFNQSGPFYFISGREDHCKQGQKLIVVVLAVRPKHSHPGTPSPGYLPRPPPSGAASPSQPPQASPNHPSPSPQSTRPNPPAGAPNYPSTPGKSPGVAPPAYAKSPSSYAPGPSPLTLPPTHATSSSLPPSPNYMPSPPALSPNSASPTPSSASPATSPSSSVPAVPSAPSPASPPTSAEPPPADTPQSSPGSLTPPGSASQNVTAPAPSASSVVTPSNVLWIIGSILVSYIIGGA